MATLQLRKLLAVVTCFASAGGCGEPPAPVGPPSGVAPEPPPPKEVTEADLILPPPFTADEIRDATPVGRTFKFKVVGEKNGAVHVEMKFVKVDADGCTIEHRYFDAKDKPVGEPETQEATWKELEGHAKYPKNKTAIKEAQVTTPAGTFEAIVYTVTELKNGKTMLTRATFAKSLPGPPIKLEVDDNGSVVRSMLLENHAVPK